VGTIIFIVLSEILSFAVFWTVLQQNAWAFKKIGSSQLRWILISLVSFCLLGIPVAIYFVFRVGPKLHRADPGRQKELRDQENLNTSIKKAVRDEVNRQSRY
jgi:hypothetical protein